MNRLPRSILRNTVWLAGLVPALAVATTAPAAINGSASLVRDPPTVPFSSPESQLNSPWIAYVLGVHSNNGEAIAALDVSITGPLHQRWVDPEANGAHQPTPTSPNRTNGDTKLLALAPVFDVEPAEDNPGLGSPLSSDEARLYGVGSYLRGAWQLPVAQQGTSVDFAYLVVPRGRENELRIDVKAKNSLGGEIAFLQSADFLPGVYTPPVVGDLWIQQQDGFPPPLVSATLPVADDRPITELTWSLESFTPSPPTPNPPPVLPSVDPATGLFTWNPIGSGLRTYEAVIRATDTSGLSDTGTLTILPSPEPTSLVIVGLAAGGLAPLVRRRSF